MYNGKLLRQFDALYDELYIGGYYRGLLRSVKVVKEAIVNAKDFIEKISELRKEC